MTIKEVCEKYGITADILKELLAEISEGTFMLGPIRFHYGCHTKIGAHCFMNFNFTV